ncbi:MAG: hypothetical protein L7S44_04245 [Flavobacteriaceae bacterium]|nr:hypothetical protein [Flavobacteriaceae bacterium]
MLKNISYNDSKIFDEINEYVGKPYTIFQRLRIGGIGSSKLIINKADSKISNLLNLDNYINKCNIEIRPKGIIIRFRSLLETYGLIIPFFKLKLFKGKANEYSIYIDNFFIKVQVNKKDEHDFFKKITKMRISN